MSAKYSMKSTVWDGCSEDILNTLTRPSPQITWSAEKFSLICCLGEITSAKVWDGNVPDIKTTPKKIAIHTVDFIEYFADIILKIFSLD